jgi:single-strand DNA-binding protein
LKPTAKFIESQRDKNEEIKFMKGLNKVLLIGNLGSDPEIKQLEGNIKVAKFSLATTDSYKDENGQTHSNTEWHSIIMWRGLAEIAEKYLHKGSLVHIKGKIKTRSFDDKQGNKKYVTEIIGDQIILLDKKE